MNPGKWTGRLRKVSLKFHQDIFFGFLQINRQKEKSVISKKIIVFGGAMVLNGDRYSKLRDNLYNGSLKWAWLRLGCRRLPW